MQCLRVKALRSEGIVKFLEGLQLPALVLDWVGPSFANKNQAIEFYGSTLLIQSLMTPDRETQ
jgi:hypothetical protein